MVYSKDVKQGYLTNKGIEEMRRLFANDIFRNEMYHAFTLETQMRDEVRAEAKRRINELLESAEISQNASEQMQQLYAKLLDQLRNYTGRKMYGYLPKNMKQTVDAIVAELAKDERIASCMRSGTRPTVKSCRFTMTNPNRIFHWRKTKNSGILRMQSCVRRY